jgi:hypothetical protein
MVAVKIRCAGVPCLSHFYIVLYIAEQIPCYLLKYIKTFAVGCIANINQSINQLINQSIFT